MQNEVLLKPFGKKKIIFDYVILLVSFSLFSLFCGILQKIEKKEREKRINKTADLLSRNKAFVKKKFVYQCKIVPIKN